MALQSDVGILQESVSSIDKRLQTQEKNGAFVADFVFNKMDTAAKTTALKAGFLSVRLYNFAIHSTDPRCISGPYSI